MEEPTLYTCPMHPELRLPEAGPCPQCGMALEPFYPEAQPEANQELSAIRRRLWVSVPLTLPLVALAMGLVPAALPVALPTAWHGVLQALLATPVVLYGGSIFFARGWESVKTLNLNMFTLIALGTGVAFAASLLAVAAPQLYPGALQRAPGGPPLYFESAAVIITLVLVGQLLEVRARQRTGAALRGLMELTPPQANRVETGGDEHKVPLDQVCVGDHLRVRPGGRVPADGRVISGRGVLDESMLTGESRRVEKEVGAMVSAGTVNNAGSFIFEVMRTGEQTLLARIVARVAEAQRSRAPVQRTVDRVAQVFVPAVIAVALLTFAWWTIYGPVEDNIRFALAAAVSVLIIACPCALGLATPVSITVSMGRGAREGVLFRTAAGLETMHSVDTLVVDKTGTLTNGHPVLTEVLAWGAYSREEMLALSAGLEMAAEHPLGEAIIAGARKRNVRPTPPTSTHSETGRGISGEVSGRRLLLGNETYMRSNGIDPKPLLSAAQGLRSDGQTVVYVAADGVVIGLLAVADRIKRTTAEAVTLLRKAGMRILIASGDAADSVSVVARRLGIEEAQGEVSPEGKYELVEQLQQQGACVAMAGDGINDAPALARADIGIAMGNGTDIAMESADITLVRGDLRSIARAVRLSRITLRNIRQNLVLAFGYNMLGVPIAAGVLYPLTGQLLSPMFAAAAMTLSSLSVLGNALRLARLKL